jgi:drug/metabolite transporter (DMT)-like permease
MATRSDYVKLHFIVFLWGFTAVLGKLITIPTVEMVLYRTLLAALGMLIVIVATRGELRVAPRDLVKLLAVGFIVAVHWLAFFGSARVSNVSVSLVGFATNSLWAALLEPWFNRTRIKKFELVLGLVVIAGLYIIFSFNFQYKLGLLLGIGAGFTSALFAVFNAKMVRRIPAFTITLYEMTGAFLSIALFLPLYKITLAENHQLQLIPAPLDWLYIAVLAIVCSVYAYSVGVELMKKISVFLLQLTLNLEPLYGIIMAVIIFKDKEKMDANFYIGTAVILAAVALYPVFKRRYDRAVLKS